MECDPVTQTWRPIVECVPPQTYTDVLTFLGLVSHYWRFIKGFACIVQPLNEHLTGGGTSRKLERVSLTEDALKVFEVLKQACMTALVLAFADYTKPFLLETDASKDGLGASAVPEAGGWAMSACHLWQLSAHTPWEKITIWQSLSIWCWSGQ